MPQVVEMTKAVKPSEIFLNMPVMLLLESDREDCESRAE
jgi:hypothetical protein